MANKTPKRHHLVPRTYLSAWANQSGTLNVEFIKQPGIIATRNKENIGGINDYYSIRAGMPLCTEADATEIFKPISCYRVKCAGKELITPLELNAYYYDFDNWEITRPNGKPVSKKQIKREIEKIKIKDIEFNWSKKYENLWDQEVIRIVSKVLNVSDGNIPAFDKDYLFRFYTALDWRGFYSNKVFEHEYQTLIGSAFDNIEIPQDERAISIHKTAFDEMRHLVLLSFFRKYLNDSGPIYADVKLNSSRTRFHFLVSDGQTKFDTSDSPAFIHKREDGLLVRLLPITPSILMEIEKCNDDCDRFYITHVTDEVVTQYNKIIWGNAKEFVVHPFL